MVRSVSLGGPGWYGKPVGTAENDHLLVRREHPTLGDGMGRLVDSIGEVAHDLRSLRGIEWPGEAGILQRAGSLQALGALLAADYHRYHDFLYERLLRLDVDPDPERYKAGRSFHEAFEAYTAAPSQVQAIHEAEHVLRRLYYASRDGIDYLIAARQPMGDGREPPLLDGPGRLRAVDEVVPDVGLVDLPADGPVPTGTFGETWPFDLPR